MTTQTLTPAIRAYAESVLTGDPMVIQRARRALVGSRVGTRRVFDNASHSFVTVATTR